MAARVERGDAVLRRIVHIGSPLDEEGHEPLPAEHRRHVEGGHPVRRLGVHRQAARNRAGHGLELAVPDRVENLLQLRVEPGWLGSGRCRGEQRHAGDP